MKVVVEIRFGPQTDDHDYNFKLKHAKDFLESGAKVKAFVFFRGTQSSSKSRERSFCCVLQMIWKTIAGLIKCQFWKGSGCP